MDQFLDFIEDTLGYNYARADFSRIQLKFTPFDQTMPSPLPKIMVAKKPEKALTYRFLTEAIRVNDAAEVAERNRVNAAAMAWFGSVTHLRGAYTSRKLWAWESKATASGVLFDLALHRLHFDEKFTEDQLPML